MQLYHILSQVNVLLKFIINISIIFPIIIIHLSRWKNLWRQPTDVPWTKMLPGIPLQAAAEHFDQGL